MKILLTREFDSEEELNAFLGRSASVASVAPTQADDSEDGPANTADVDSEGMPFDAAVHAASRAVNADGTWRAMKGKSDEAKAARAAWKAKGGPLTATVPAAVPAAVPAIPAAAPAGLPGVAAAPAGLPGLTLPAPAPEPISVERLLEKAGGMYTRGKVTAEQLQSLYLRHTGSTDGGEAMKVFNVNETARAGCFADLAAIEPELS